MPAPASARIRTLFEGQIDQSRWSCGIWGTVPTGVPSQVNMDTYATAVHTLFSGNTWADLRALNAASTNFTDVIAQYYGPGSMAVSAQGQHTAAPVAGTATQAAAGAQAIVASLYTGTVSRSGRGRIFLPATGGFTGGAQPYGFPTAIVTSIAADIAVLIANMKTVLATDFGGPTDVVVQSLHLSSTFPITNVLVDTRPDRQEHREKAMTFVRVAHAV